MKEITFQLDDKIADAITKDARERGIPTAELCRSIFGEYVVTHIRLLEKFASGQSSMLTDVKDIIATVAAMDAYVLKARASRGELSCSNCTLKLSVEDVEEGKCSSCRAPIKGLSTKEDEEQQ